MNLLDMDFNKALTISPFGCPDPQIFRLIDKKTCKGNRSFTYTRYALHSLSLLK
jgi:hypothetical protein